MEYIYPVKEDSVMLCNAAKKLAKGNVLDMGTGSGYIALAMIKKKNVKSVTAADINKYSINNLRKKSKGIKLIHSDLFSKVPKKKFDTIIFNPPYLPMLDYKKAGITKETYETYVKDKSLEGGKHGYETIVRFIVQAKEYLSGEGIILLLFSSLSNKKAVDDAIAKNLLEYNVVGRKKFGNETLYVYKITKNLLLRKLHKKKYKSIKYLTRGKRGWIHTALYKGRKVAVKSKNPHALVDTLENEAYWLKYFKHNKIKNTPKFTDAGKGYIAYEFIEGIHIDKFLVLKLSKRAIISLLNSIIDFCTLLDKLKIDKKEMSHPSKHILVNSKGNFWFIDFERARKLKKPGNLTGFCQFITRQSFMHIVNNHGISYDKQVIRNMARQYKLQYENTYAKKIKNYLNQLIK